jgi:hypothetical protein
MKNALKVTAMLAVLSLAACKNDKPAANTADATNAAASLTQTPSTPTSTTEQPVAALAAPSSAPQTAQASVEKMTPSAAQISPSTSPLDKTNGKVTTIKLAETSYDWGTIKEGEKMTHVFKFTNTGKEDLVISEARGSCGCTVPEWPKEPIKPGKGGEMKVVFDSANKSGAQSKSVTITANTEPAQVVVIIKGNVESKGDKPKSE